MRSMRSRGDACAIVAPSLSAQPQSVSTPPRGGAARAGWPAAHNARVSVMMVATVLAMSKPSLALPSARTLKPER